MALFSAPGTTSNSSDAQRPTSSLFSIATTSNAQRSPGLAFGQSLTHSKPTTSLFGTSASGPVTLPNVQTSSVRRVAYGDVLKLKGPILQVSVGTDDASTFYVHQDIIVPRSEFFKRATNGQWLESDERLIRLPEDDPEIFHLYINLLYFEVFATKDRNEWTLLCKLYVLVERLQDTQAKNRIIDAMVSKWLESRGSNPANVVYPLPADVEVLYEGTCENSLARKLLVDIYAEGGNKSWVSPLGVRGLFPEDFTHDLVIRLYDRLHQAAGTTPLKVHSAPFYYEVKTDGTGSAQKGTPSASKTYTDPSFGLFGSKA